MSELIKSYDNAAGRTAQVRYDTARYPRPFWVDARGSMMLCGTYRTQEEAEHAAAHFMATGALPKPETAQKPREGVDATPGAVSTHAAPKTHFATPLQRQETPAAANRPTHSDKS